jgi:hypothetical protein
MGNTVTSRKLYRNAVTHHRLFVVGCGVKETILLNVILLMKPDEKHCATATSVYC